MNREFHSQYPFALEDSVTQATAIDFLVRKRLDPPHSWSKLIEIDDDWMRISLLAQSVITAYKDQARVGAKRDMGGYRYWLRNHAFDFFKKRLNDMHELCLVSSGMTLPHVARFPSGSWSLQFNFTLRKPYISRDDTDLHILDNPIKKEWVFKVPYIAPSQWKGALRSAMVQELVSKLDERQIDRDKFAEERLQLYRLFGNEKDGASKFLDRALARHILEAMPDDEQAKQEWIKNLEDKTKEVGFDFESELVRKGYRQRDIEGFQGSLHFYPTYFSQIGLEVINPHDRRYGAGEQPIYFECVPKDADGIFALFCMPICDPDTGDEAAIHQAEKDLEAAAKGIRAMMTCYGFGAKTSSGFGVAEIDAVAATIKPEEFRKHWLTAWEEST